MAPTVPIEFTGQKESRKFSLPPMMGKSRKYSKGHSSGFVPDFRHAVETIGESEGFGSSGRVDTEMTVSEDSHTRKRKCISLNADSCDSLVVPTQVLSLSKMSRLERKDLESRLKMELERVRTLQRKVFSLSSNAVVLSPSSDIRSCSDGKKRPPLESFQRSSEVLAPHGKKRPPAVGRNGSRPKKSKSGHFEPVKLAAPANTSNALLMEKCKILLEVTRSHQYGWVFNEPVDVVKLKIPDYFTVIKHPMDLGTVKSKIASGGYLSPLEFAADVRLTFSNAMTYNPPGNDVHIMAKTLSKFFEARWKAIEKKLSLTTDEQSVPRAADHVESEINTQIPLSKRKKTVTQNDASVEPEPVRRVMTGDERQKLSTELEALLEELPESIVDFLKEHSAGQPNEEEIEIDIDALSDDTLFTLRKLLDDYMLESQKNQEKAEPCEIELHNESGFSNSSLQPCNDHADEDVDVVNDPPVSSHSPVEIEKDIANRNSKCSSSSSSSGESGSSSSDSDSGSSLRSETDAAKGSVPVDVKENLGSGATSDPKKNDLGDSEIENYSVNEVGLVEQNSQCKPMSAEADGHQDGESAPSERQVSPEKLYRAALLRSRFADTILKAREKALEKDEKRDPEKLRLEREELERRQKEEKARLQAEAKAAEEFRRKAEAEAAAEAKRKRELDREAARQALLKMEKTVDINENSQFMEDLEMLTAAHDEHLQSFTEETSPDHSENGFGSFKLQGSNPLEQLGLYMKVDDEDEEEVEPPECAPEPANDVEEGEID
ncbi:transcription factor GTE10-like isoform X2 [Juglans regia]|uniref:Transcription factor GTE10-like isoform X2 n=1 Tax=Juglans regia TaxID=51240 RepID=A0A6P9E528_JUGRE|nr:transcription factor GTE10-like isoform X2 [Juglans regia]